MSLRSKIQEHKQEPSQSLNPKNDPKYMKKLQEREYRMDMLYEKWKNIPELGGKLKEMDESKAKTTALRLEQQTRYMRTLTETQVSDGFFGAAPDHMLRLVMFSYPNSIRPELFTEFQMETAKDSIKYIRAFYNEKGSGAGAGTTPQPINRSFNPNFTEKPMVESPEGRIPTELAQLAPTSTGNTEITFTLPNDDTEWKHGYLDGWSSLHTEEGEPLAFQRRNGEWVIIDTERIDSISGYLSGDGVVVTGTSGTLWSTDHSDVAPAYFVGRYNSELDIDGEHLGDAKLRMESYQFQPRPITMGLSWTHLSEIILGSSFNASVEELLYQAVGEEIRKAIDIKAVRIARQEALKSDFFIEWDARPFSVSAAGDESASVYNDTYIQHAQLVTHAIARLGDMMYNELLRGGVSRIVGGPAAISYLTLHEDFSSAGAQVQIGPHKAGTLGGIPVFKVPSNVIPDDELVLFWKNDYNEADVAAAFGVLVPFFSTGTLQRKTFYKEAGVAYYGDHQVLQPKYFSRLKFRNLLQLFPNRDYYNND